MHRPPKSRGARRTAPGAALAALAVTSMLLAACGDDGTTAGAGADAAAPRSGGTLTFAVGSDTGCVDPQQVASNDTIYSVRQIVDSLTDQDPRTGEIVPWLAERWEVSPDGRSFTFHLRPGVTFSDGTPLTAQVVKENFDVIPNLGTLAGLAQGYLSGYTGTTVVDELTATVTFGQPNVQFLQGTSTHSLGLVASASTRRSPQQRCSEGVIGSGPFVLSEYVPNQSVTLTKRTGYNWGSSLWSKPGEAYLDRLVFRVVPEAGVRTSGLSSGQVDAIGAVGRADEAALKAGGITLQARANPGVVFGLGLNNSRPLLRDERVRRAILLAVDRQQVVDTVFPTGTKPATSVLAHTTPGYTDLSSEVRFDPEEARSLLAEAGWTLDDDGIRRRDGAELILQVYWFANAATNKPALELIQQQLKAVGVGVELAERPIAQLVQIQRSGEFDVLWGNLTRADPDILRNQFSTQLVNAYRLPPGELDTVLADQAAEPDQAKRWELVGRAQRLLVTNAHTVPVVELQTVLGVSPAVHDLKFDASSRIQLHDTWKS